MDRQQRGGDRRRGGGGRGRRRGGGREEDREQGERHGQRNDRQQLRDNRQNFPSKREPQYNDDTSLDTSDDNQNASIMAATSTPPLTEPIPQDTPRFADLADGNLVDMVLVNTLTRDLKFDHMMPVQAATLNDLLPPNRADCLVQAKTGTGKTLAFLLPALQTLISKRRSPSTDVSLLVISPTRELAMQIAKEANNLLQRLRFKVCIAIGGTNKNVEERQILAGCDVLIATPGRLFDHMSNENILYNLQNIDTLVLDEADRLLDMGFMNALRDIVGKLADKKATNRQGMLFSATIAPHVEKVAGIVLGPDYKFISTIPKGEANTHERVPQLLIKVPNFSDVAIAMVGSVRHEIGQHRGDFKAVVFAPTAALADLYGHILSSIPGVPQISILHSRINQNKRTKVTDAYRNANSAILVATDVVARGMDFPGVTAVFQVGIPADKESYIHRLGRTARAGSEGRGIFIVTEAETWFPRWTLKEINFIDHDYNLSSAEEVYSIVSRMEENERAKIYQAWLGYYKNHLKALKWTPEELVRQGNALACDGMACPENPPIGKSTASKMGLRGVRGLTIVADAPKARRGGDGGRGGRR